MLIQIKSIFKHSSVYSLGTMLGKVVSFIMLPIYTRCLSPSDYGTLEMLTLSASVITMLLSLKLTSALPRFYYGYDEDKRKSLVSTMLICTIALSALVAAGLFQARGWASLLVFKTPDKAVLFGYVFANMVFEIAGQIAFTYLRVLEKSALFAAVSVAQLILGLSLNILFLVGLKLGIMGVLYSMVLSNGIIFIALQSYAFARVGFRIDLAQFVEILKFSLPLVPATLAVFVLNMGDRFMLSRFVDTAEIGVYSLGYKFGMLLGAFVGVPFLQAWEPKRIELFEKDPEAKRIFSVVFVYFFSLLVFGSVVISTLIGDIVSAMSAPEFKRACVVTPFVAFGYVFYTIFYVVDIGIVVSKKTFWYPVINTTAAAVNVGLNFILIPRIGILGAAVATAAAFGMLPFCGYLVSLRYYPVRYDFVRAVKVAVLGALYFAVSCYIDLTPWTLDASIKTLYLATFPFMLGLTGFFAPQEILFAKGALRSLGTRFQTIFARR